MTLCPPGVGAWEDEGASAAGCSVVVPWPGDTRLASARGRTIGSDDEGGALHRALATGRSDASSPPSQGTSLSPRGGVCASVDVTFNTSNCTAPVGPLAAEARALARGGAGRPCHDALGLAPASVR